jgi:hypothetical protein
VSLRGNGSRIVASDTQPDIPLTTPRSNEFLIGVRCLAPKSKVDVDGEDGVPELQENIRQAERVGSAADADKHAVLVEKTEWSGKAPHFFDES